MIDTRAFAQEVQDQLRAAAHRGQEQLRKSQDQLRKSQDQLRLSQDQVRKGRDAVADAIRSGNELVKAVRPNIPRLPVPSVRVPSLDSLPGARLRANVQDLASQILASQRDFADRAMRTASPLVADGAAKLTQAVGTLPGLRNFSQAGTTAAPQAGAADPAPAPTDKAVAGSTAADKAASADKAAAAKSSKPRAAGPRTTTTGAGKTAGTPRASTPKK